MQATKVRAEETEYYQQHGLDRDPFPVDRFDNVFYRTEELKRRFELIEFVIEYSQQLVIVTSAAGAGKSSFARQILKSKPDNWKMTLLQAKVGMEPEDLSKALLERTFPNTKVELEEAQAKLHKYLEYAFQEDILPIIIIDDAEKLPLNTLEFIMGLANLSYNETEFRILLFADERIHDAIEKSSRKDRISSILQKVYLPSFTYKQTVGYIKHRLSVSGNPKLNPFTDQEIFKIHKVSGGLARGINVLARQALETPEQQQEVTVTKVEKSSSNSGLLVFLMLLILGLGGYIVWQELYVSTSVAPTVVYQEPTATEETEQQTAIVETDQETVVADSEPLFDESIYISTDPVPLQLDEQLSYDPPKPVTTVAEDIVVTEPEETEPVVAEEVVATEETELQDSAGSEETQFGLDTETDEYGLELPVDEPEISTQVVQEPEQALETPVLISEEEAVISDSVNSFNQLKSTDWLYQQVSGGYALQLISASDVKSINKILAAHSELIDNFSGYVNYTKSGKPRYVLLYGSYGSRQDATAAVQALPSQLARLRPWPRSFKDIHKQLDNLL